MQHIGVNTDWFAANSLQKAIELHPHIPKEKIEELHNLCNLKEVSVTENIEQNGNTNTAISEGAESECAADGGTNVVEPKQNTRKKADRATT